MPESNNLTTIVTEFGKFRYNIVPMVLCASSDIFQYKLDELLGDIEGVKTYTADILVIGKMSLSQHIDQLRVIFDRLCTTGLKFDAPKCIFWFKYIPYLGYIITRVGIKPNLNKVQWVVDIRRSTIITGV